MDQIISDIFEKYQIRKNKKQKTAFIEYTSKRAEEFGYEARIEKGTFGTRNIVVGDPDKAKLVFTAHYDTCPVLPFPNFLTPLNFGIYLLYNLAILLAFFAAAFCLMFIVGVVGALANIDQSIISKFALVIYWALFLLLLFGPANKHTANDNTSGVTVLFGVMKHLPTELRDKVAFVFFDLEEAGMIGSSSFASKHKAVKAGTLTVNFDCVSDGEDMLIVAKKNAEKYTSLLSESYESDENVKTAVTNKAFYPSDQTQFKCGVGVASFKKTRGGMLYMDKIHTPKDTVYRRENIDYLVEHSIKLAENV